MIDQFKDMGFASLLPVSAKTGDGLDELKQELFNLRFQHATGQLDNPMRIKDVKKSIARIKTVQRENEMKA